MPLKMVSCREIVISHLATMISHLAIVISYPAIVISRPAIRIEGVTAIGAASPDGLGWRRSHFAVMAEGWRMSIVSDGYLFSASMALIF